MCKKHSTQGNKPLVASYVFSLHSFTHPSIFIHLPNIYPVITKEYHAREKKESEFRSSWAVRLRYFSFPHLSQLENWGYYGNNKTCISGLLVRIKWGGLCKAVRTEAGSLLWYHCYLLSFKLYYVSLYRLSRTLTDVVRRSTWNLWNMKLDFSDFGISDDQQRWKLHCS